MDKELTIREKEVLYYVTQGLSNPEIAEILFVSTHTVKAHITSILRKLNIKNRTNLAYFAGKNDLINKFYKKFSNKIIDIKKYKKTDK